MCAARQQKSDADKSSSSNIKKSPPMGGSRPAANYSSQHKADTCTTRQTCRQNAAIICHCCNGTSHTGFRDQSRLVTSFDESQAVQPCVTGATSHQIKSVINGLQTKVTVVAAGGGVLRARLGGLCDGDVHRQRQSVREHSAMPAALPLHSLVEPRQHRQNQVAE